MDQCNPGARQIRLFGALRRFGLIGGMAAVALAAGASTATASQTIGQLAPSPATTVCNTLRDRLQPTVTSGAGYVVPTTGGVTNWRLRSWSHNAGPGAGQTLGMKVFRKIANPANYAVVAHDGPRPLTSGVLNTFVVNIPVRAGDVLGSVQTTAASVACSFPAVGDSHLFSDGNLADGASEPFTPSPGSRLNMTAVIAPTNSFAVRTVKRDKKKGTATFSLVVPNPGGVAVRGKGVKPDKATAGAAGDVKVKVRAKGKKRRALNASGKATVKPDITFTPIGGDPGTQPQKVKLKKG